MKTIGKRFICGRGIGIAVVFLLALALATGAVLCGGCDEKEVSLEFDPRSGAALITVESDGGLPYPGDDLQPLFRLFADGSFIAYDEEPGIFVRGELDEEAIAGLLRQTADTGFFDLKDEYSDPDVYDATYRRITVDLPKTQKTVTVWMLNDVPDFDKAYALILDYPRGDVKEYVPEVGYLVVVSYPLQGGGDYDLLDPNSDIYKLLPDSETLKKAADNHTALAVDGATFMQLKKYDNGQESRGLVISQPDSVLIAYPVYLPRTADMPLP